MDKIICPYCNKQVYEHLGLEDHIKMKHECQICGYTNNRGASFSRHLTNKHSLTSEEYFIKYISKGIPTCECGCRTKLKFGSMVGYARFVAGHVLKSTKVKEMMKKNNQLKYGVDNVFQRKDIKKKIKKTMIKNHGVDSPIKSKLIKEKIKKTNLEKYGVENVFASTKVKEKNKKTFLAKYGVDHQMKVKEIKDKVRNTLVNRSTEQKQKTLEQTKDTLFKKYGETEFRLVNNTTNKSKAEYILSESTKDVFIHSYKVNKYEFDIHHEKTNTLIEVNGVYYHPDNFYNLSFTQMATFSADLAKSKIAKDLGYNLIAIRDHDIIKDMTLEEVKKMSYKQNLCIDENIVFLTKDYLCLSKENYLKNMHKYKIILKRFLFRLGYFETQNKINKLFEIPEDVTLAYFG